MKLNTKRTIFVGFAFFLILAFWQAYDNIIPLILTNKFGMSQFWSGVIMALDNVLALVLLPLFGTMSDKHKGKRGRRTPFIRVGTVLAVVLLLLLTLADSAQLKKISAVSTVDDPTALELIYDTQADRELVKPNKEKATLQEEHFVLSQEISREDFVAIRSTVEQDGKKITNPDYVNYVVPARQAYVWQITAGSPQALILFVGILLLLLVAMSTFRSPAVALMPDVTLKPLRSKGNAVINLMGYFGGICVLALGKIFATDATPNAMMSYTGFFAAVAALMLVALVLFLCTVREPKWVDETRMESLRLGLMEEHQEEAEKRKLSAGEKRSLLLVLASVVLWFFGYNAITTKYSVYATNILGKDFNLTLTIATVAAIVSFVPVGILSSKIGRKRAILMGVALLAAAFAAGIFISASTSTIVIYGVFVLAGIAWATINVNSFPMVVEMCSDGDVGKYTGYYYTASMAAQTMTPMLSGFMMDRLGMGILFPYAVVFVAGSFVTMLFVRHGDSKIQTKKGLEAFDIED